MSAEKTLSTKETTRADDAPVSAIQAVHEAYIEPVAIASAHAERTVAPVVPIATTVLVQNVPVPSVEQIRPPELDPVAPANEEEGGKVAASAEPIEESQLSKELAGQLRALIMERLSLSISAAPSSSDEEPVLVSPGDEEMGSYSIPKAPAQRKIDARWVKPGEEVKVQGLAITAGLLFTGTTLPAAYGDNDPCLIDPSLSITEQEALGTPLGYWPSYSRIGSASRRTYLEWLARGRVEHIEIGFVFLFFYGLERRVLIDAKHDEDARKDLGAIDAEIRRLLAIYGPSSYSFQRYANSLLDAIQAMGSEDKLYAKDLPELAETYELPLYLKIALGQASRDGAPLPASLALMWARRQPGIYFRTAAERCAEEFEALFRIRYSEKFGAGMKLPHNRTKLKFSYQPASSGFRGQSDVSLDIGDLPDVTAMTGPIEALHDLVKSTTGELEAYSRLIGKAPEALGTGPATLLLPAPLWPQTAQDALTELAGRVRSSFVEVTVKDLLKALDLEVEGNRKQLLTLSGVLGNRGIAVEPYMEEGARTPKPDDHLVLFNSINTSKSDPNHIHYRTAQLTLQLAAIVALADGDFSEGEQRYLAEQIAAWEGLTEADRLRLKAHMRLMAREPVALSSLKKKIQDLSPEAREAIAGYMATLSRVDGAISPDEVRILEKAYKAMGLESGRVFSDLHATETGSSKPGRTAGPGLQLDPERVRALQRESQEVSRLLEGIFVDEAPIKADDEMENRTPEVSHPTILGLDHEHAALAHLLLSRTHWQRSELLDASADIGVMLDGALERINEAAYDQYDMPFFEGEEPMEVNQAIIDSLRA